jgi:hypothetical protein
MDGSAERTRALAGSMGAHTTAALLPECTAVSLAAVASMAAEVAAASMAVEEAADDGKFVDSSVP